MKEKVSLLHNLSSLSSLFFKRKLLKRVFFFVPFCFVFVCKHDTECQVITSKVPPVYIAEVIHKNNNFTTRAYIYFDNGQFREGIIFPSAPQNKPPQFFQIFNKKMPYMVWSYNAEAGSARPTMPSALAALSEAAKKYGEEEVCKKYGVPARYRPIIIGNSNQSPPPQYGLLTKASQKLLKGSSIGKAKIAGRECFLYQSVTLSEKQKQTTQAWVDPKTDLILKWESRYESSNPLSPPMSSSYNVVKLETPKHIFPQYFELPMGVKAYVPKIFNSVVLPKGVKRMKDKAPPSVAGIGINLEGVR